MDAPSLPVDALRRRKSLADPEALAALGDAATRPGVAGAALDVQALEIAGEIRRRSAGRIGIETFLAEFGLSTAEGVALMCLAEALLRIPDPATVDLLIRDKLGSAEWLRHVDEDHPLAINASAWALALTGRVSAWASDGGDSVEAELRRVFGRLGGPVLRVAVERAMALMGSQFVAGRTIAEALARAARHHGEWPRSFDMLGEAARTAADARRYAESYAEAIAAVGRAASFAETERNSSVSIKLSALHPRYEPAKRERVMAELLPVALRLCLQARRANIQITLDAEEADRLALSLEIFRALAAAPETAGWNGLGLAVQAYQKRAPLVVDWLIALARGLGRRIPVRLVKGAYWDSEIKWAQVKGLADYPVYRRKAATDLSYRACAARLLGAGGVIYGQFATHNPRTAAEVLALAGARRDFEFQKLHGMGDSLFEILGERRQGLAVRVYAPVGEHRDLLPYLVRRLLENGANTSFVHQVADPSIPLAAIVRDPRDALMAEGRDIPSPGALYPDRRNAAGTDLEDETTLAAIATAIAAAPPRPRVADTPVEAIDALVETAARAAKAWSDGGVEARAAALERAADALEADRDALLALLAREGGKTIADGVSEIREAVDFCRYYAQRARADFSAETVLPGPTGESNVLRLAGRGVFVCISPWNFPLAIFVGQVAAALAAGNAVIAKPAEQTPTVAARAVALLHQAGVPQEVLALAAGPGESVGRRLVEHPRIAGVAFTGSTETAWRINRALAAKDGPIVPLIAETGGINAMLVDSSALAEQVVADVVVSAFQSAGQRCSALRILYLQEEIVERTLAMLAGAMAELRIGDPADPATDVGPVIDQDAAEALRAAVAASRERGRVVGETPLPDALAASPGRYVAPIAIEVAREDAPRREIFGPVLHVVRYAKRDFDAVLDDIAATGFCLTLGVHSRIDATVKRVAARGLAGNFYVNRSMIGAVVGVQPFGGHGLSGTGPKAGGPHYLARFAREIVVSTNTAAVGGNVQLLAAKE